MSEGLVHADSGADARAEKSGELENLKAFARDVISSECWGKSFLDGDDIQELAEHYGLIAPAKATVDDIEAYDLECTDVGDTFFKFTAILDDDFSDEQPTKKEA